MNRDLIFDGNRIISPMMIILVTMGLFMLVAIPPLGLIMIILGGVCQRRFRRRVRRGRMVTPPSQEELRAQRAQMFRSLG